MEFNDNYRWLSGWIHDYYCDKDGSELIFDNYNNESNRCGKITAQGLNEAMISIQMINCINNVSDYLNNNIKQASFSKLFKEIYKLLKPQVNKIHNMLRNMCYWYDGNYI